jgi:hypothetical protein
LFWTEAGLRFNVALQEKNAAMQKNSLLVAFGIRKLPEFESSGPLRLRRGT